VDSPLSVLLDARKRQRRVEVGDNASSRVKEDNLRVHNVEFQDAVTVHIRLLGFAGREKLMILSRKVDLVLVVAFLLDRIKVCA
jgi:hypothetical protein